MNTFSRNSSLRLAIDFDGTIADTNRTKSAWIKEKLGLVVEPWLCDRTNCVALIGNDHYTEMGETVYNRDNTLRTTEVPAAAAALRQLATRAELLVVTARPLIHVEFAREWFIQNGIFSLIKDVHSSAGTSKEAICQTLRASALIDDDLRHLENVQLKNLSKIHFQNGAVQSPKLIGDIIVCQSWGEVVEALQTRLTRVVGQKRSDDSCRP